MCQCLKSPVGFFPMSGFTSHQDSIKVIDESCKHPAFGSAQGSADLGESPPHTVSDGDTGGEMG